MAQFNGRVIQIGVGGFGRSWINRFAERRDRYQVTDIVDVSPEALADAGRILDVPEARRWRDFRKALAASDADLAVIVTPPAVHSEQTIAALQAGKHVILAKPMAPTWEECVRMTETAEATGRIFAVEQNYRYRPENLQFRHRIRQEIASGGQIGHIDVEFWINADFGPDNFRTLMQHPLTLDMMIHHADLLRCFTDCEAEWVMAVEFNPPWSWYRHPSALRMLIGLNNGVVAGYRGCWATGGRSTDWNGIWRCQVTERRTLVRQSDRIEVWDSDQWGRNSRMTPIDYEPERYAGWDCLEEVVQAIREDREPWTSARDNLGSMGIVLAAAESAERNGARVPVPRVERS